MDFHGEKRKNQTHESTTDPEARLFKKSQGSEAKLGYLGHVLMENRNGLLVETFLSSESEETSSNLNRIYGPQSQEHLRRSLQREYELWRATARVSRKEREQNDYASPEKCKEQVLGAIDKEIGRLTRFKEQQSEIESKKIEVEKLRQSVPDSPGLDRLMRYEASLERSFDRTLGQLERVQRARKGQAVLPAIKVDVTT